MAPLAIAASFVLTIVAMGGASVGRIAAARMDVQRAVDAASLTAARIVRERGLPFDAAARAAAEAAARANTNIPLAFNWTVTETAAAVRFTVQITATMPAFRLLYPAGTVQIQADASGEASQQTFTDAQRRLPKLVMVLDYSGSMGAILPGSGGQRAITVLEDSVRNLLDAGFPIDYGGVFFSSNTFRTIPIGTTAPAIIKAAMAVDDAGGATCTSCGINSANAIISAQPDTGRYVLVVSDGQPNNGGGEAGARASAAVTRGLSATIITLHIDWSGGTDATLRNFMVSISGPPGSPGNTGYYYRADNATTLRDTFSSIVASIVCSVGPLTPVPSDPASMRVYLRSPTGVERLVPAVADLSADPALEAYRYDSPTQTIRMSDAGCHAITDDGDRVVARYGQGKLVD